MPTPFIPAADIERVFEAWRKRQPRPAACRLRQDRKDLIRRRLQLGYTADEFVLVIDYIYDADEDDPRWMRGQNPRRREYLGLDNILRRERLATRVEAAEAWKLATAGNDDPHTDADPWRIE